MPQMMPLNWLTLMIFFNLSLMIFCYINYYNFLLLKKEKKTLISTTQYNWKW